MKLFKILAAISFVAATLILVGCGGNADCVQHTDSNKDFICDNCNTVIERPECEDCKDENKDGKCDACQSTISCTECTDEDEDGYCDVCDKEIVIPEITLDLISKGTHNFSFVLGSDLSYLTIKEVDTLITKLKNLGYTVNKLTDTKDTVSDPSHIEVLVGHKLSSRGEEYSFNGKALGPQGYAVKIINNSIIVSGGSDEAIVDALKHFTEYALGITDSTKKLTNASFSSKDSVIKKQTNFPITSVKVGDRLISDYVIAYDPESPENLSIAKKIQEILYTRAGYYLEIVKISDTVSDKFISVVTEEKSGKEGFEIKTEGDNLQIISEFPHKALEETVAYINENLIEKSGDVVLKPMIKNIRDVNYEMFGAIGDGDESHDDFEAIKKTHEYANKYGHSVVVDSEKTYYIGPKSNYISVRTNVDFGGAHFIIDDSKIALTDTARGMPIFIIENDAPSVTLEAEDNQTIQGINASGGIKASELKKLDLGLGYSALLVIINTNHKNYIVYGPNANNGISQTEIILVDENGNVDSSTPLLFDYTEVTSIKAYPTNTDPITVNGGIFTTVANQAPTEASRIAAYQRGIRVTRANTTVKNVTHYVVGEGEEGMPYDSFMEVKNTYNVLFYKCTYTARKTYYKKGTTTGMGSYDISAGNASHVVWANCNQTNFFKEDGITPNTDGSLWGIMGSSACKNLTYDGCILSRFDAHAGVYNTTIRNSSMQMFRIVGGGELILEGVHMYSDKLIQLREDYGAFWLGKVTLKDVTMHNSGIVNLFTGTWYNHDFGYQTALPTEIEIDGLRLAVKADVNVFSETLVKTVSVSLKDKAPGYVTKEDGTVVTESVSIRNKIKPTEKITVKNNTAGYNIILPSKTEYPFFKDTEYNVK